MSQQHLTRSDLARRHGREPERSDVTSQTVSVGLCLTTKIFHRRLGSYSLDEGYAPAGEYEFIKAVNLLA